MTYGISRDLYSLRRENRSYLASKSDPGKNDTVHPT